MKGYRGTISNGYNKTTNLGGKITQFITGKKPTQESYDEEKISELDSYGLERNGGKHILKKNVENQNVAKNNHAKKIDGIYQ